MAWEQRGNIRYFYRKRRLANGVVESLYIGNGLWADIVAARAESEQQQRFDERVAMQNLVSQEQELDAQQDRAWDAIVALVDLHLGAVGYHKHRGTFRRRRNDRGGRA